MNRGELVLIVFFSCADGLLGVLQPVQMEFLSRSVGLSPAELSVYTAVAQLPWVLKPVIYYWCRTVPFFGSHRKSYLMLCSVQAAVAWLTLALLGGGGSKLFALGLFLVVELHAAVADLFVDALVIERIAGSEPVRKVAQLQTLCAAAATVTALVVGFYIPTILDSWRIAGLHAWLAATAAVSCLLAATLLHERPPPPPPVDEQRLPGRSAFLAHVRSTGRQLGAAAGDFAAASLWKPTAFLLVWLLRPSLDVAMLYLFSRRLAVSSAAMRSMDFSVKVATLSSLFFFDSLLSRGRLDRMFTAVALCSAALLLPSLFVVSRDSLDTTAGVLVVNVERVCRSASVELVYRAALLLAAHVCHHHAEPGFYSLLMAVMNAGEAMRDALSSLLLWLLGITDASFAGMLPYTLIVVAHAAVPYLLAAPLLADLLKKQPPDLA